jgi:hypothetical protein
MRASLHTSVCAAAPQTVVGNVTVEQTAVSESGRVDATATSARSGMLATGLADDRLGSGIECAQTSGERVIEVRHEVILSHGPATLRDANLTVQNGVNPRALSLPQVLNAIIEGGSGNANRSTPSEKMAGALRIVMADGSPLPAWLVFDPETKTLTARDIPEGTPPLKVRLQAVNGDALLGESEIMIDTK